MKKKFILVICLSAINTAFSQSTESLIKEFGKRNSENQLKFEKLLQEKAQKFGKLQLNDSKESLAGFAGNIPIFLSETDTSGNSSANITALQNGTIAGLNGNQITGSGINILVMDGGRVHDTHQEFGGITNGPLKVVNKEATSVAKSNHSTNVTGIILAAGNNSGIINWYDSTTSNTSEVRGVLVNATSKNYTFTSTSLGTNYQKLAAYGENISNHSYGINLGWAYVSTVSSFYPQVGFYWIGNYELNHQDTYSGSYNTEDADFDKIVYTNPNQIVVKSAGNYYGTHPSNDPSKPKFKYNNTTNTFVAFDPTDELPLANCSQGYYCIGWGSLAKNIIVVGATDQLNTSNHIYSSSSDVQKADFSSAGPRRDGAIKPDISAVGVNIISPAYDTSNPSSNTYYWKGNGTSYAAPIISGIAGAVTQVNRVITGNTSFTYRADEMKTLLTHTANEAGNPGPDVWYGWGFADATKAAQVIIDKNDKKAYFERNSLNSGVKFTKTITSKTGEPLKATISWVDPAATPFTNDNDLQNNHASRLINDLDLRIVDTTDNTTYYPWKLDVNNPIANATKGDNLVDNVEQVIIENPVAGRTYRIEVSNKGSLVNDSGASAPQNYALIITGVEASSLGTSNTASEKLISVYPTRTKDIVNILIPKSGKSIEVFDISGKSVLKTEAKSFQTLDLSYLPKGIYIINIKTESETVSKKVIKE